MDRSKWGVHIAHCCKFHGCKYGDEDCPVVDGLAEQAYLCMDCFDDLQNEDYYKHELEVIDQIKVLREELRNKSKAR